MKLAEKEVTGSVVGEQQEKSFAQEEQNDQTGQKESSTIVVYKTGVFLLFKKIFFQSKLY